MIWRKMGQFSNGTFLLGVDQTFLRRRSDLQGIPLTIGFQTHEIISKMDRETSVFTGYYGDLVMELSRSLNFSLDLKPLDSSTMGYGLLLVRNLQPLVSYLNFGTIWFSGRRVFQRSGGPTS